MEEYFVEFLYPGLGLDLATSYEQQRVGTTRVAHNVRYYEPSTDRARGGSRPGLARYINQQLPLP